MEQNNINQKLADWNDEMVKKHHAEGTLFESKNAILRMLEKMRLRKIIRLAKIQKNDIVLDLGCGEGFLISLIPNFVQNIVGLDISKTALNRAKEILKQKNNIELMLGDAENLNFPNHFFNKIICSEMLEHVPNPKKVMGEIYKILKDNGLLVISVPDEKRTQFIMKIAKIIHLDKILGTCRKEEKYDWHLHEADKKFIKDVAEGFFKVKKIYRNIPLIGYRFIATLAKK